MNPLAAGVVVLLVAAVLALPFLIMSRAARGGAALLKIVRLAAVGTIVVAAGAALVAVMGLSSGRTTVTVPVSVVPIRRPQGVTFAVGPTATVAGGGFDRVSVVAEGLSPMTRLALGATALLWSVMAIAVALVVLRLVRTLDGGDPFALSSTALATTGWIVMVGGTAATWMGSLGDWLAASDLFAVYSWTPSGSTSDLVELGWPEPGQLRLDLPWMPLLVGLGLALLAAVFRHGAQLRQDAAGLV